jgi:DNA-binding GntR family transcriptional regulator
MKMTSRLAKAGKRFAVPKALLHERVADMLRDMIVEGELAAGDRLKEVELCELLSVSRTPVREAIKVLASEGLVQLTPQRGAMVTETDLDQLDEMLEMVGYLEAVAAYKACSEASEKQIAVIKSHHIDMLDSSAKGDRVRYFRSNQKFHHAIIEAAGNSVLSSTHARLNAQAKRLRYAALEHAGDDLKESFIDEHQKICDALERRDSASAFTEVLGHLGHVSRFVTSAPIRALVDKK